MNLNDDVVDRRLRLGPLHKLHPGGSRSLVRYDDRLHMNCLLGYLCLCWVCSSDESPFDISCQQLWSCSCAIFALGCPGRYSMKSATVVPIDRSAGRSFPIAGMYSFHGS